MTHAGAMAQPIFKIHHGIKVFLDGYRTSISKKGYQTNIRPKLIKLGHRKSTFKKGISSNITEQHKNQKIFCWPQKFASGNTNGKLYAFAVWL